MVHLLLMLCNSVCTPLYLSSGKCCDEGKSFLAEVPDSPAAKAYREIIQSMLACKMGLGDGCNGDYFDSVNILG